MTQNIYCMQGVLLQIKYLNRGLSFKNGQIFFFRTICHPYVTRMLSLRHSYLVVCHPYYVYVIRMSVICTRMSFVCPSSVVLPWAILIDSIKLKCLFYCCNPVVNGCFWSFNSHKYDHIDSKETVEFKYIS